MKYIIIFLTLFYITQAERSLNGSFDLGLSKANRTEELNGSYLNHGVNANLTLDFMPYKYFGFMLRTGYSYNGFDKEQMENDYNNYFGTPIKVDGESSYNLFQVLVGINLKTKYFFDIISIEVALLLGRSYLYIPSYSVVSDEYGEIYSLYPHDMKRNSASCFTTVNYKFNDIINFYAFIEPTADGGTLNYNSKFEIGGTTEQQSTLTYDISKMGIGIKYELWSNK